MNHKGKSTFETVSSKVKVEVGFENYCYILNKVVMMTFKMLFKELFIYQ